MVMAVRQLIADNPDPTEDEVRSGLSGNICRCTGYQNIVDAVLAAAQMIRSAPAEPGSGTSPAGAPPAGAPRGVPGES